MIVGEEDAITLNRTILSEHFTFWIVYVTTTTELTSVWAFFVIASICILSNLVTMGKNPSRTQTTHTDFCCHQIPRISRFSFSNCFYFFYFTNLVAIVKSFAICFYAFYVNSSFHVVLLSTVRYFITIYPLKCRQHLTLNTISLTSLLVMFISSLFAGVMYNIYDISDIYVKMVNCELQLKLWLYVLSWYLCTWRN